MNELTVFTPAELPEGGPDFIWHADVNVVELRAGMCLDGKLAALAELQKQWRREHLSVVEAV